jgi:outer membrane lipoprotein SlyB
MLNRFFALIIAATLALTTGACVAPGSPSAAQPGAVEIRQGVIEQISTGTLSDSHHTGVGAVVGGLAGLGIGSLIGAGTGRDVAMVAGALGGALAGNEVQKKYDTPIPAQQIIVRVRSGVLVQVTQPAGPTMVVGERVYIEGSGEGARVVPQTN